jgi:cytochrome c-type biogenesis protein CcmH/NrfG
VRISTFCLGAVLCLLLGTYLGTVLSAFHSARDPVPPVARHGQPQPMPSQSGQEVKSPAQLQELEAAVRKNPQDPHAWIQLGNRHFDDDKPREAIRAYEQALSIKGDNPDVLTDMGIMYRHLGNFERAAELFTQAGKIDSRHEQSRFNLGVVLFFDLNRKDEARKAWRELVGINPGVKTPDGALLSTMLDELK